MDPLLVDVPERLETARLVLRCARAGDGAVVNEGVRASLAELRPWMAWAQGAPTLEASESVVRRMHADFTMRSELPMLMFERLPNGGEGLYLGGTGLHSLDWNVPRFEIGYWRRTGFGGHGLVVEAVVALNRMAFDVLGAQRVEIRMDARNLASRRVAELAGFSFEGVLRRDSHAPDGQVRDSRVYSRVRGVEEAPP